MVLLILSYRLKITNKINFADTSKNAENYLVCKKSFVETLKKCGKLYLVCMKGLSHPQSWNLSDVYAELDNLSLVLVFQQEPRV